MGEFLREAVIKFDGAHPHLVRKSCLLGSDVCERCENSCFSPFFRECVRLWFTPGDLLILALGPWHARDWAHTHMSPCFSTRILHFLFSEPPTPVLIYSWELDTPQCYFIFCLVQVGLSQWIGPGAQYTDYGRKIGREKNNRCVWVMFFVTCPKMPIIELELYFLSGKMYRNNRTSLISIKKRPRT